MSRATNDTGDTVDAVRYAAETETEVPHSPEPWSYREASTEWTPFGHICLRDVDGRSTVHVPTDIMLREPVGRGKADAKRVLACVNACAGIDSRWLNESVTLGIARASGRNNPRTRVLEDLLGEAMSVITNVGNGDWSVAPPKWMAKAQRLLDDCHRALPAARRGHHHGGEATTMNDVPMSDSVTARNVANWMSECRDFDLRYPAVQDPRSHVIANPGT